MVLIPTCGSGCANVWSGLILERRRIFNWDSRDPFYNPRRALTKVVTLACQKHDEFCFCTNVGLAPDATKGPDVMSVRFRFVRDALNEQFTFHVGQFGMFSLFGLGESTFMFCSSSTNSCQEYKLSRPCSPKDTKV